jgi:LytS/YehU family sensor histidine kinase
VDGRATRIVRAAIACAFLATTVVPGLVLRDDATAWLVRLALAALGFAPLAWIALRAGPARERAALNALKGQLQPHFLFNAMASLKELIETEPAAASELTQRLADLYRLILSAAREPTTPLARELTVVRTYLEIERLRFGDRLRYHLDVPAELEGAHVPSLMVQTLVENAVKHGVTKATGGGEVSVTAARRPDGDLELVVANTGPPYDPDARRPAGAPPATGLPNTRSRLELMYGGAGRFSIAPDGDQGTRVRVVVSGARID